MIRTASRLHASRLLLILSLLQNLLVTLSAPLPMEAFGQGIKDMPFGMPKEAGAFKGIKNSKTIADSEPITKMSIEPITNMPLERIQEPSGQEGMLSRMNPSFAQRPRPPASQSEIEEISSSQSKFEVGSSSHSSPQHPTHEIPESLSPPHTGQFEKSIPEKAPPKPKAFERLGTWLSDNTEKHFSKAKEASDKLKVLRAARKSPKTSIDLKKKTFLQIIFTPFSKLSKGLKNLFRWFRTISKRRIPKSKKPPSASQLRAASLRAPKYQASAKKVIYISPTERRIGNERYNLNPSSSILHLEPAHQQGSGLRSSQSAQDLSHHSGFLESDDEFFDAIPPSSDFPSSPAHSDIGDTAHPAGAKNPLHVDQFSKAPIQPNKQPTITRSQSI